MVFGSLGGLGYATVVRAETGEKRRRVIAGGSRFYSRAVEYGGLVFVAGVLGRNDAKEEIPSEFESQCRLALANLKASVEAAGSSLDKVLKCTCFLTEASDFATMNKVYTEFFPTDPPARSTVVVKELVMADAKIEIDCVTFVD